MLGTETRSRATSRSHAGSGACDIIYLFTVRGIFRHNCFGISKCTLTKRIMRLITHARGYDVSARHLEICCQGCFALLHYCTTALLHYCITALGTQLAHKI